MMGRAAELVTAGVIAACGVSAMVWWPDPNDAWPPVALEDRVVLPLAPEGTTSIHDPERDVDPALITTTYPGLDPDLSREDYSPPGALADGDSGWQSPVILAPGLRFPLEAEPAFANSQSWGVGGYYGPSGDQCAAANYTSPWRDTFCETGGGALAMCPAGQGHAGQDIRPSDCQAGAYWAVAAGDGVITSVGAYSVRLMGEDGTRFTYLHLDPATLMVEPGDRVSRGERIGTVSNAFGGTPATIHLHFEMRMAFDAGEAGLMTLPVPPYTSLIAAYQRLERGEDGQSGA